MVLVAQYLDLCKSKSIYHSLGQLRRVQWSQPACLPSDWSPAAYWSVVLQTAGCMQADLTSLLPLECMAETQVAYIEDRGGREKKVGRSKEGKKGRKKEKHFE